MAMLEKDRNSLRKNLVALTKYVMVDDVLIAHLSAGNALTESMCEVIDAIPKQKYQERSRQIVDFLQKRDTEAFRIYIEALIESEQGHLADMLDKALADGYRRGRGLSPPNPPASPASGDCHLVNLVNSVSTREEILPADTIFPDYNRLQNASPELIQKVITDPTSNYKIDRSPRGKCVIICIDKFLPGSNKQDREGSWNDVINLTSVFEKLHFVVELWHNLTTKEIRAMLKAERKNKALKENCMFVMVMITGWNTANTISGTDGETINITEDIIRIFNGAYCPALVNKPKIFFIQNTPGYVAPGSEKCDGAYTVGVVPDDDDEWGANDNAVLEMPIIEAVHEEADLLIVSASVPGYKPWRNLIWGSWFITDLTVALIQHAHDKHLQEIITIATRYLSERIRPGTGHKQISQQLGSLRRDLYLLPGYNP